MPSSKVQSASFIHLVVRKVSIFCLILFVIFFSFGLISLEVVFADDFEWYPDQTSFAPINANQASWFDTLNWFNLAGAGPNGPIDGTPSNGPVPGSSDVVQLIGEDILAQPAQQQAYSARHIVFGDFLKEAAEPENNALYAGGKAQVDSLYISGDWTLDFGTNVTDGATGGLQVTQDGGLQIGYSERSQGTANVQVIGPGALLSNQAGVGNDAGVTAAITVDGTGGGTAWQNNVTLAAGASGTGTIVIQNGAALTAGDVNLGLFSGGVGKLSVMGIDPVTNTPASFTGDLEIGQSGGSGSFSVTAGATATIGKATLAVGVGSHADVTVSGAGSTLNIAQSIGIARSGTITASQGGQLLLEPSATFGLAGFVGSKSTLNISDPTTFAKISPRSSQGEATINVTNGATVQSANVVNLSSNVGGTTFLTVDGQATTWTAANGFDVGSFGAATATVSGGAQVAVTGFTKAATANTASAQLTVTGAGSKWSTDSLQVGQAGKASLLVEAGGTIETTLDTVFASNGGVASLTVTGAGSSFSSGEGVTLGIAGNATLDVNGGGTMSARYLQIAGNIANPDPTISMRGIGSKVTIAEQLQFNNTVPVSIHIEDGAVFAVGYAGFGGFQSQATATVTGAGSQFTSGTLAMSSYTPSLIRVTDGGLLQTGRLLMGSGSTGAESKLEISNAGSRLEVTGYAEVGARGKGYVAVSDGASVTVAGITNVAENKGTPAKVTLDGQGSAWTNAGTLSIGESGNGTFAVSGGAILKSSQTGSQHGHSGFIGESRGATGEVTVSDPGSLWQQDGILAVGYTGTGTLTVSNAGVVKSDTAYIAQQDSAIGTATVTGAGSSWNVAHDLVIAGDSYARNAQGQLFVQAGASVASENGFVAPMDNEAVGTATVSGINSVWTLSDSLFVGTSGRRSIGGSGTVNVNSAGLVEVAHNLMVGYYGSVDVTGGGAITVGDAAAINGAMHLGEGGLLAGYGQVIGNVINDAGTISPAFSTGPFNIAGSFTQGAAGTLILELLGPPFSPPQSDILHVSGDVLLGGTLKLGYISGLLPQVGQTFDLITVGGAFATNDLHIQLVGFPDATRYTTDFVGGNFQLTFTAVPEPGTCTLALVGVAACLLARARRRKHLWRRFS